MVCLIVANYNVTFADTVEENSKIDTRMEAVVREADKIEILESGTRYTFDEFNSTILASIEENGVLKLVVDEGICHDIVEIDKDANVYLNGIKVKVFYEQVDEYTEGETRNVSGWHYRETPGYGKASEYTTYKSSTSCRDIQLGQTLVSLSVTALMIVLGQYYPAAGQIGTITAGIIAAFGTSYTKNLSYKTRITWHKDSAGGWNTGGEYCEQHTTTWYTGKDFTGQTTTTVDYRCKYII